MTRLRRTVARLLGVMRARRLDCDLEDEMAAHLDEAAADLRSHGLSPEEARRTARLRFGGLDAVREAHRDIRSAAWIDRRRRDVADAARAITRRPAFSATVLLTLALGVGTNLAIVAVADQVLLAPLPYDAPDEIYSAEVVIPERREQFPSLPVTIQAFLRWRETHASLSNLTALRPWEANVTEDGEPERLGGALVSANFFSFLGVPMTVGRGFDAAEEQVGRERVVVISHALWRRRYNADPSIIGRALTINDTRHTVVGVAGESLLVPTRFALHPLLRFGERIDVWKPIAPTPRELAGESWDHGVLIRLPPARMIEQEQQELAAVVNGLIRERAPDATATLEIRLVSIRDIYAGRVRLRLLLVLAASALLLLTACASLADLFLARMASRSHEFATRLALGASRTRIAGQVLTEAGVLAALGGPGAMLIASWGSWALFSYGPVDIAQLDYDVPRLWLAVVAMAASFCVGLACAMPSAWQAAQLAGVTKLREVGRGSSGSPRARRDRQVLIAIQMTLATALLSSSALLLHSFVRLMQADRGYQTEHVLTVDLSPFGSRYEPAERRITFYEDLVDQIRSLGGVTAAGAINYLPALSAGEGASRTIFLSDDQDFQRLMLGRPVAMLRSVTSGYFAASGTSLTAGRFLNSNEPALAAVVSESLARRLWPGEPVSAAVGRRVRQAADARSPLVEIVGVVADVYAGAIDRDAAPSIYRPYPQWASGPMTLVIRTSQPPEQLVSTVRAAIRSMDSNLPIAAIRTMDDVVASTVMDRRFQLTLTIVFGVISLLLGAVGLYGVVSYSVACKTQEIGLRLALGAARRDVVRWVVAAGMRPVVAGLVVGVAATIAGATALRSTLFGIQPADPLSVVVVAVVLVTVGTAACYLPARRAASLDPMRALRHERS